MAKPLFLLPWLTAGVLLSGCDSANDPSSWYEVASQGTYTAEISTDGRFAVVGARLEGGSLWNIADKARLYDWNHKDGERSLLAATGFSPQARFAATADQQNLVLWHTDSGQPEWFWRSPGEILDLVLAPQGQYALLGLDNHEAVLFDAINGGVKRSFLHGGRVRTVDLSADASIAITGADDYTTALWSVDTGEKLHELTLENVIDAVALSPDGKVAFSASTLDQAVIWDTTTGQIRHTLSSTEGFFPKRVSYIAARFSNDGSQLLTGTASGLVQLWNVQSGQMVKSWRVQKRKQYGPTSTGVNAVGFGAGSYYAVGSNGILNILK